jgi:hypothetical protein
MFMQPHYSVCQPLSTDSGNRSPFKTQGSLGHVEMERNGRIGQREIEQGTVLLCSSKPLTGLVIDK